MTPISDIIKFPIVRPQRERAMIINDLFALYTSPQEEKLRAKAKLPKPLGIKPFCIRISHLKVNDLYFILSIAKDRHNRGESVSAFIFGSIKPK